MVYILVILKDNDISVSYIANLLYTNKLDQWILNATYTVYTSKYGACFESVYLTT